MICGLPRVISFNQWRLPLFSLVVASCFLLASCKVANWDDLARSQQVYQNARFGYTVPYPVGWVTSPEPTNQDGQTFINPDNPTIAMRVWASNRLATGRNSAERDRNSVSTKQLLNFETEQGIQGNLDIIIGQELSILTLTLPQASTDYSLQAQAPGEEFANYYKLFHALAHQYRIQPEISSATSTPSTREIPQTEVSQPRKK